MYNDGNFLLSPATNDADIDMELGWDIEQGEQSIIVAVLDSGIKLDHPEFSGRLWTNPNETLNGIDDDNNGYIDDINGWDFANNDDDPTDDHGHGTNVTGIIGANSNNNLGYSGIDLNCKLMIVKILDQNNSGYYSWWTNAIYYAVDNGAKVINMSVGGSGFSSSMKDAIDYAYNNGVTVVAFMMNENNNTTFYPAAYQNTIAMGATNPNDERSSPFFWSTSSGSNYGNHIDVVAPGNYIYGLNYQSDTNYNSYWGGTSQAAPLVTGLSSLLLAQDADKTPDDIRNIIRNTAEDQVGNVSKDITGFDIYYGYGRINAYQALLHGSLSTDEFANTINLSIFPNPISNFVTINSKTEFKSILIRNILCKEIFRIENSYNLNSLKLDFTNFESGIYIVSILSIDGDLIVSKKIIKK
ncbi:S8 family peptidase [Polaribacter sp.]|nr:S8 family peptidase [Polaribacter sp.]